MSSRGQREDFIVPTNCFTSFVMGLPPHLHTHAHAHTQSLNLGAEQTVCKPACTCTCHVSLTSQNVLSQLL